MDKIQDIDKISSEQLKVMQETLMDVIIAKWGKEQLPDRFQMMKEVMGGFDLPLTIAQMLVFGTLDYHKEDFRLMGYSVGGDGFLEPPIYEV